MGIVLGTIPACIPGFLRQRSGTFPERFRRMFVPEVSRGIRLIVTEHPKIGTLSCWSLGTLVFFLCSQSLPKFVLIDSMSRWDLWLAVPRLLMCFLWHSCFLLLISQRCHFWEKGSTVVKNELFVFLRQSLSAMSF